MSSTGRFHLKKPRIYRDENDKAIDESSSDSSDHGTVCYGMVPQEHARPRLKAQKSSTISNFHLRAQKASSISQLTYINDPDVLSNTSLTGSITRFRGDFDTLKCKLRVFDESLDLCRCLANDYKFKMDKMEKRLSVLERRQKSFKKTSNYSVIIQKNKALAHKSLKDIKKLQMSGTEEEMREVAVRICRNYLHGPWKTIDPKELDFKRISGGLSNFLYYVALPDDTSKWGYQKRDSSPDDTDSDTAECRTRRQSVVKSYSFTSLEEPRKVLLRIYGQVHGERAMDAIVTESVIFTLLSERRLGPRLHGVFSGGRIEEYIPARPLLTKELAEPSLSMKIAEKMAAIHSMDVPLSKEPNWIWKTMNKWLKTVKEERLSGNIQGKNEEEQRIIKQLKETDLEAEIEWLKKFLASVDSLVVFCHNDMQEGNILLIEDAPQTVPEDDTSEIFARSYDAHETLSNRECESKESFERLQYEDANTSDTVLSHFSDSGEPKLVLIDFEYCSYNYRGFDIANHFQEWGFDYTNPEHPFYFENQDYTPSLEQKEIFIREYLKYYHSNNQDNTEATLDDVNKLLDEVEAFACASHLFWGLWSIVNASKSQIPFGYWEYALARLETYLRLKQEVIKKDKYGLPQKRKICEVDI